MNGNVTKDGIQKDLAWMHRTDIGGFQNFDAGLSSPKITGSENSRTGNICVLDITAVALSHILV